MYASCRSAQRSPSSRVVDWFWPSGSSVTMKVERFERETTSVWTFRFPWRVGRALGIRAASSLSSSGGGFSTTEAASGSRNSIFATAGVYPGGIFATPLPVLSASCRRLAPRSAAVRRRRWLAFSAAEPASEAGPPPTARRGRPGRGQAGPRRADSGAPSEGRLPVEDGLVEPAELVVEDQ